MKKLVSLDDINKMVESGKKKLYAGSDTIVTPAAKDAAAQLGIEIVREDKNAGDGSLPLKEDLIYKIVMEVLKRLPEYGLSDFPVKETDISGIMLVRGSLAIIKKPDNFTGKPVVKKLFSERESPAIQAGFLILEKEPFAEFQKSSGIYYIIDGSMELSIDGRKYMANQGDVFFLPKGIKANFCSSDGCKVFFASLAGEGTG